MSRIDFQPDRSRLQAVEDTQVAGGPLIQGGGPSVLNPFLRCTLPMVSTASPDSLRQFYQPGIPQHRIMPVAPLSGEGIPAVPQGIPVPQLQHSVTPAQVVAQQAQLRAAQAANTQSPTRALQTQSTAASLASDTAGWGQTFYERQRAAAAELSQVSTY